MGQRHAPTRPEQASSKPCFTYGKTTYGNALRLLPWCLANVPFNRLTQSQTREV